MMLRGVTSFERLWARLTQRADAHLVESTGREDRFSKMNRWHTSSMDAASLREVVVHSLRVAQPLKGPGPWLPGSREW